ncbi:acyl-CoA dehydrogenase family protein [Nocardia bovistercoris]|uniref:acyl-CoA dehydrogenase family protein n=1 Tax=Nocardia bovistercoris TaxID=2785916 RepID=UPI001E62D274|nr:acyl-CoA dehydrogenase family protein [Nocardia bovistercoris]
MTAVAADRVESAEQALRIAHELAAEFAVGAAARDRDRTLPHAEIDRLAASGLLAITVPAAFGGADLPASTVADVVRILAAADPNIAQIPHSHFVYLNLLRLAGDTAQQRRWFGAVLDGARIANAQSERRGATVADIATTVRPDGAGFRVDGAKYYCTGSLFADLLAVLTRLDDPEGRSGLAAGEYVAFLPADAPGVRIVDDWQGMGQRTTGSGTVEFDAVSVDRGQLVPRAAAVDAPAGYGAFAQLLHAAIDTGIARGALTAAVGFVRESSRPWFEAGVERAIDDPLTIQRFGELAVQVTAAESTLASAGLAVDRAIGGYAPSEPVAGSAVGTTRGGMDAPSASEELPDRRAVRGGSDASGGGRAISISAASARAGVGGPADGMRPESESTAEGGTVHGTRVADSVRVVTEKSAYATGGAGVEGDTPRTLDTHSATAYGVSHPTEQASLAVAAAKILADRAATEVSSALFEVSGTRSATADLDHFWRNARTHTLHDPVRWKYQHLGRSLLHGTPPPRHGVF